jgi:hypothetical protein
MRHSPLLLAALLLAVGAAAQQPDARRRERSGLTLGTIKAIDSGRRRLTLSPMRGAAAGDRVVALVPNSEVYRLAPARIQDLRPGDMLNVVGLPLQIEARQIRIGDVAPGATARPVTAAAQPARPAPKAPAPKAPARPAPRPTTPPAPNGSPLARVYGRVTRLTPLQVTLPGGINVQVKTGKDTRFTRAVRLTLAQIKIGEPAMVFGATGADGVVAGNRVQVGLEGFPTQRLR